MDARTNLKDGLPSRHVTEGPARAPHRSHYYAMGLTDEQIHAHECGVVFDLFDVAEVFKRTPYIADLKPAGRFVAKDLLEAGSVPLLMKTLLDNGFMHGDCMTVTGCSMAENLKHVAWNCDQDVIRPADCPLMPMGGVAGLRGNLAPEGGDRQSGRNGESAVK